jgi:hypothetical protein
LSRKWALAPIIALFFLWFFSAWHILWPNADACFFFVLGAYLSLPGKSVTYLDKFGPWISAAFLVLLTLESAFPDTLRHLHKFVIIFGVPSAWWISGLVAGTVTMKSLLLRLSSVSFFVFAAHVPLLTIMREVSYELFVPTSGMAILALYFLIPICLVTFLVAVHSCLVKATPSFAGFITGDSSRSNLHLANDSKSRL